MALFIQTAPTTEPVTLAEAKAHCRVDVSDDDALITALIVAARQHAEAFTHRAIPSQVWDLKLDSFPWGSWHAPIVLPMPPVTAVGSVTYLDPNGASQTWSSANYTTDFPSGDMAAPARIVPIYGVTWPQTQRVINAVTVRFTAGYTTAPEAIKAAMKLLIGHWYAHRETVVVGTISQQLPMAVEALLWPYKSFHTTSF
jgi:uncharacterized phiE125 gp8 family phage protein